MFLYPKGHKIYEGGHLKPFSGDEVSRLRTQIDKVLREPKYITMAELAEL